jgi:hypothetical protein
METFLTEYAHPISRLEPAKGEAERQSFERFQQTSADRSPDENGPEPAGESNHDEGKEESHDEEFVACRTACHEERGKEKSLYAVDTNSEETEAEEEKIYAQQESIDVSLHPPRDPTAEPSRIVLQPAREPIQDLTGNEQTRDVLVKTIVSDARATIQCVVRNKEGIRSMTGQISNRWRRALFGIELALVLIKETSNTRPVDLREPETRRLIDGP